MIDNSDPVGDGYSFQLDGYEMHVSPVSAKVTNGVDVMIELRPNGASPEHLEVMAGKLARVLGIVLRKFDGNGVQL